MGRLTDGSMERRDSRHRHDHADASPKTIQTLSLQSLTTLIVRSPAPRPEDIERTFIAASTTPF